MQESSHASVAPYPAIKSSTDLFRIFLVVGATAFGMSMLENLRRVALSRGLLSEEELTEGLAMVQLYPGPIMFDLVAFIGYRRLGIKGATAAGVGFILPATLMMLAVAGLYERFGELPAVRTLSVGLGAAVVGVIAHIAFDFAKKNLHDTPGWALAIGAFAASVLHTDAIAIIGIGFLGGTVIWRNTFAQVTPHCPNKGSITLLRPFAICAAIILAAGVSVMTNGPLASLVVAFMKIGATAFGNASTILPMMQEVVVADHAWLTPVEFNMAIALGNLTPGPVLNSATFIGYHVAGVAGGIAATLAIFAPSFALTLVFSEIFGRIHHLRWVRSAIQGVTSVFVGLLASTILLMARPMADQPAALIIGLLTFILLRLTKIKLGWVFLLALVVWVGLISI